MQEKKKMPYREALPYLLKQRGWSYRELDRRTYKSASYWNQTVKHSRGEPKNAAVYEMLAEVFEISPLFFEEYSYLKASELVLKDPSLAYMVVREAGKK